MFTAITQQTWTHQPLCGITSGCSCGKHAEVPQSIACAQVAAGQLLARALTASLPGIDANDPPKSLACFRLYTVALCSIGALKVTDLPARTYYNCVLLSVRATNAVTCAT